MSISRFALGQTVQGRLKVDEALVMRFADLSGDYNPIHVDAQAAILHGYSRPVAHGLLSVALLSRLIGMELPGPGAVLIRHEIEWLAPVFVGDEIVMVLTVEGLSEAAGIVTVGVSATNQEGKSVMRGRAQVSVPAEIGKKAVEAGAHRVALITGGSRGIGAAIGRRLASSGYKVALGYRESTEAAQKLVHELRASGVTGVSAFQADLFSGEAVQTLIAQVLETFGRLDIIVHCATPRTYAVDVASLSYAQVEPYLHVYLGAALEIVRAAASGMAERGFGRFVFLGTSAMFAPPRAGWGAFLIAKHALYGLVRNLAVELGPHGITSNMVSPGMTVTDLTQDIPVRVKEVEARKNPTRRLATTQDTADLVAFLVSDAAGYINGANLPLTGGP